MSKAVINSEQLKTSLDKEYKRGKQQLDTLLDQRKYLKNKAKIVSLSEYKKIIKEIEEGSKMLNELHVKIDKLS